MTVTSLPTPPTRADSSTFSTRADAFVGALPVFVTELNALGVDLTTRQADVATNYAAVLSLASATSALVNLAAGYAEAAASSASAAATLSTAELWVSGTTYAVGDAVWSPATRLPYRRLIAGAGTTDPSADATNWGSAITSQVPEMAGHAGQDLTNDGSTAAWGVSASGAMAVLSFIGF